MKVYKGLDFTYKFNYIMKDCITSARNNPFSNYIWIVKDPTYIEEAFFKHTDALFNIEIMTLETLLHSIVTKNKCSIKKISKVDKIMLLKKLLREVDVPMFNDSSSNHALLGDLLDIFDSFYYSDVQDITTTNLPNISKEKIEACYSLYTAFLKNIPTDQCFSLLDVVNIDNETDTIYYFIDDCIPNNKIMSFVKQLDINNTVYILANYGDDNRQLHSVYKEQFDDLSSTYIEDKNDLLSFLMESLFSTDTNTYSKQHPFSYLVERNPKEEIKSVCFSIYKDIVDQNMQYQDFAIYYPNTQYLELLQSTLQAFSIPYNGINATTVAKEFSVCLALLQYASTKDPSFLIRVFDSMTMKTCSSFQQANYYKKAYSEKGYIEDEIYQKIKLKIDTTYIEPLQKANTIESFSERMYAFTKEELVFSDSLLSVQNFFYDLTTNLEESTLQDFISFIEYLDPSIVTKDTTVIDHVYLFDYHQYYSGIVGNKKIYLVGVNETIVPSVTKNEGILLDNECRALGIHPTIGDTMALQQNHLLRIVTSNQNSITLSYSMGSVGGDTLLPSSMLNQLREMYNIPAISTDAYYVHPALANRLYAIHGKDSSFVKLNSILAIYKQTKNQPPKLTTNIFGTTMSASQLEVYNGCPYKYFNQYGLSLQPFRNTFLQANEIGTLVHHVLETSSFLFKDKTSANNVDISTIENLVKETISQYLQEHPEINKKISTNINKYFIDCLTQDVYTTILVLINQMKVSTFHIDKTEEKTSSDYGDFSIKGFVDRVDVFSKYLKVIDYKSNDKELDLGLALQGFNIQMLVYMKMLCKNKQLEKGALLYFNTKKRILKSTLPITEKELPENFLKQYRMNGYVVEDVIEEIDNTITSSSNIIKVRYVKSKDKYTGNILNPDSFTTLVDAISQHVTKLYHSISSGDICITPKGSFDPTIHTKVNPCHYCPYRAICNIDVFYNSFDLVKVLDANKILGGEKNGSH